MPNFSVDGVVRDGAYLLGGEFLGLFASFFTLREDWVSKCRNEGKKLVPGYRGSWCRYFLRYVVG